MQSCERTAKLFTNRWSLEQRWRVELNSKMTSDLAIILMARTEGTVDANKLRENINVRLS